MATRCSYAQRSRVLLMNSLPLSVWSRLGRPRLVVSWRMRATTCSVNGEALSRELIHHAQGTKALAVE
jgi:hypothetical protein